jgi:hypothetical protein
MKIRKHLALAYALVLSRPRLSPAMFAEGESATGEDRPGPQACPACSGSIHRIPRRVADRLFDRFVPVYRYRCASVACQWEGNVPRTAKVDSRRTPAMAALFVAVLVSIGGMQRAYAVAVPPLALPGPYAVECSNVMQDFTRLAPGEDVQLYWEGVPRADGTPRNPTDLLTDPANTPSVTVDVPNDGELFGAFAGRTLPFMVVVCHPTTPSNPRPDYALPTGRTVAHMQRGADLPLWPDATTRFPVLVFSNGYGGSPLSNDYINAVTVLASFGYVVAAPFHTDVKFSDLNLESINDIFYLLTHLPDFNAMQALRPLELSATIDLVLGNPQWRDRVDPMQVGGFGASMGGESLLLMAGAGLTTTIGQSWKSFMFDTRLKAAVGYVPYFGQFVFPAFGRFEQGLDGITLSYLAISGTADTTAPITETLQGINVLAGPRELVALTGVKHGFDVPSTNDIFTWTVTYLDAEVKGDAAARAKLLTMTSVSGGGDDNVLVPYNGPAALPPTPVNYGGLWWNAPTGSESGWALNLAHQGDVVFMQWATYDATGKTLWLSMTANLVAANTYSGTVYQTTGPSYSAVPFDPSRVVLTQVGTATLTFNGADSGTFVSSVNGVAQSKNIIRGAYASPVAFCKFGALSDLSIANNYQDVWTNAPLGSEPGWSVNIAEQGGIIFAFWSTYDLDGTPLWLSATMLKTSGTTYVGTLLRTTGPPFAAIPFDPTKVTRTAVGSVSLVFASGNAAAFSYNVNGIAQTKQITRYVFRLPGTVCR